MDAHVLLHRSRTVKFEHEQFRVALESFRGAVLSTVDLITDVYMTVQFFHTGRESYGRTNAWLIGIMIFIQITRAYANNSKKLSGFFRDAFCILIGFKPALDAYKVGPGAEQERHQLMEPLLEMS